jgi:hypothetical protein
MKTILTALALTLAVSSANAAAPIPEGQLRCMATNVILAQVLQDAADADKKLNWSLVWPQLIDEVPPLKSTATEVQTASEALLAALAKYRLAVLKMKGASHDCAK